MGLLLKNSSAIHWLSSFDTGLIVSGGLGVGMGLGEQAHVPATRAARPTTTTTQYNYVLNVFALLVKESSKDGLRYLWENRYVFGLL